MESWPKAARNRSGQEVAAALKDAPKPFILGAHLHAPGRHQMGKHPDRDRRRPQLQGVETRGHPRLINMRVQDFVCA